MTSPSKSRKPTGVPSEKRPVTDWERIEAEYRAGQLSVSEIARQHKVSHPLIFRRAKKEGWTRNLAERIAQAVTAKAVTDGVTGNSQRETIELAAERGVQVVREHRALIRRNRSIAEKLAIELETDAGTLKDRSAILGNLSGAIKTLIGLERQAFNIESADPVDAEGAVKVVQKIERVIVDAPNRDR